MARAAVIPQSPPKRATRGRAKGTTTTKPASKPTSKTTKGKASNTTTETRQRNVRAVSTTTSAPTWSDTEEETEDEIGVIENKTKGKGTGSRGKLSSGTISTTSVRARRTPTINKEGDSGSDDDELAQSDAPKKRVGRPRGKAKEEETTRSESVPKTRGRPKGTTAKSSSTVDMLVKENTRKNTFVDDSEDLSSSQLGRNEVFITTNSAAMRSNMLRGPAKKKKVTFQDVSDSEEERMVEPTATTATGRRKRTNASGDQGGLGGKPVRKPPTPSTRGRKPAASKEGAKPLSPKKATQVAKAISSYASSDGEDDELSGAKHKVKLVVLSPRKDGSETTGLSSPVRRINFTPSKFPNSVDENGEPTIAPPKAFDFSESLFMSSPARRPPPSPFNYTMRETPKRGNLSLNESSKPLTQPNFTPTQDSPLKALPKKANLETPRRGNLFHDETSALHQSNLNPPENSPLKLSARRGIFSSSISSQPHLPQSSTPFKSSLLQSPAKKVASPFKSSVSRRKISAVQESKMDVDDASDAEITSRTEQSPLTVDDLNEEMEPRDEDTEIDEDQLNDLETALASEQNLEEEDPQDQIIHSDSPQELLENMGNDELQSTDDSMDEQNYQEFVKQIECSASETERPTLDTTIEEELGDDMELIEEGVDDYDTPDISTDSEHDIRSNDEEEEPSEDTPLKGNHLTTSTENQFPDKIWSNSEHERVNAESQPDQQHLEFEKAHERSPSEIRQSLVNGLEDVFTDGPLASNLVETDNKVSESEDVTEVAKPDYGVSFPGDEEIDAEETMSEHSALNDENDEEPTSMVSAAQNNTDSTQPILPYEIEEPESMVYANFFMRNILEMSPARVISSQDEEPNMDTGDDFSYPDFTTEVQNNGPYSPENDPIYAEPMVPIRLNDQPQGSAADKGPRFTLLAEQLSLWKASSPEKAEPRRSKRRGVFSLAGNPKGATDVSNQDSNLENPMDESSNERPLSPSEGNIDVNDIEIHEDDYQEEPAADSVEEPEQTSRQPMSDLPSEPRSITPEVPKHDVIGRSEAKSTTPPTQAPSPIHESSEEEKENESIFSLVPFTPIKDRAIPMQTFHTVSKVPLKPAGDLSPLKVSRKRGRSLSTTSPVRSSPRLHKRLASSNDRDIPTTFPRKSPRLQPTSVQKVPVKDANNEHTEKQRIQPPKAPSRSPSPSKAPRKSRKSIPTPPQCLRGAVVYVDVHTTEGEDASGIFFELLQQMGARCIKNWSWNPRSSLSPVEGVDPKEGRVGITHVVFKDGGVRTLEKVRHAAGLVKCVGVGWVLDCERENKWLDEAQYAVDSSIIPRGGAKRRKSMEPRALSNMNGTLIKSDHGSSSGRRSGAAGSFMRSTPLIVRDHTSTPESTQKYEPSHTEGDQDFCQTPQTPGSSAYTFNLDSIGMSPATPFYLSQRSRLVQQTCPPKQTQQGLFASRIGSPGEPSQMLKAKLEAARRKSLAFKPAIGSPLVD